MADEKKVGSLILNQLGMFNEAVIFFENIVEPAILEAFDKVVENFANENNWHGAFDLEGGKDCCLLPSAWIITYPEKEKKGKYEYRARFEIVSINDQDDYWTACFCRQASAGGEAGFVFSVNHNEFGGVKAWNAYAANIDSGLIAELVNEENGFKKLGTGEFFLPIHLDADKLKSAWEAYGNINGDAFAKECFEPLNTALETLESTWGIFDKIMSGCSQAKQ
jgi:hypothetical protein